MTANITRIGRRLLPALLIFALAGGGYSTYRFIQPRVLAERLDGSGSNTSNASPSGTNGNGNSKKDFAISGDVSGLYPGIEDKFLVLTVNNPNNFDINVQSLTVSVGNAPSGCSSTQISVTNFSGSLPVPANGFATKSLPVTMLAGAPTACESADWPLTYGGSAVKR